MFELGIQLGDLPRTHLRSIYDALQRLEVVGDERLDNSEKGAVRQIGKAISKIGDDLKKNLTLALNVAR